MPLKMKNCGVFLCTFVDDIIIIMAGGKEGKKTKNGFVA